MAPEGVRLQVVLARAGVASRRKCEDLIRQGRVTVNGKTVKELGTRVNPAIDHVKVNGKRVETAPEPLVYILLNKPKGTLSAASDDTDRPVVTGLLKGVSERVFPVGRLDWDTEGVLLLTNDGDLAHKLTHPKFEVPRTYEVKVRGMPIAETLERMRTGVYLEDGRTPPATVKRLDSTDKNAWLEITVHEGRNRLIRRMCQAVGHPVMKLRRVRFAGLTVTGLAPGQWRYLRDRELARLQERRPAGAAKTGKKKRTAKKRTSKKGAKKKGIKKRSSKKRRNR